MTPHSRGLQLSITPGANPGREIGNVGARLVHTAALWHQVMEGVAMHFYNAICSAIEAWAERTRSEGLEQEFANADWASTTLDED